MHFPHTPWLLQEGHALFLHAPASPGVLGALRDYLRVGFGTRILMTSIIGVLLQQPPTLLLLQQIAVMLLVRADYCRCACRMLWDGAAVQGRACRAAQGAWQVQCIQCNAASCSSHVRHAPPTSSCAPPCLLCCAAARYSKSQLPKPGWLRHGTRWSWAPCLCSPGNPPALVGITGLAAWCLALCRLALLLVPSWLLVPGRMPLSTVLQP